MGRRHSVELLTHDENDAEVHCVYQMTLMPVWDQHQVLRRTLPLVAARVSSSLTPGGRVASTAAVAAMVASLSDLKEEDHDFCVNKLLSRVQRQAVGATGAPWANVWNAPAKTFLFDDMNFDLMVMYRLLQEAVEFTYGNFMQLVMSYLPKPEGGSGSTSPP